MERGKEISMDAEKRIADALVRAIRKLPDETEKLLLAAKANERGRGGRAALDAIADNLKAAERTGLPLCQDTGMFWCLASIGRDSSVSIGHLDSLIRRSCQRAAEEGYYRRSVVSDPIYSRINTGTNLPPVISYEVVDGSDVTLRFLLKGFGSENCSSVRMINPTAGEDGVVSAVLDMMEKAGGKPCPPVILGIGVGGTMDRAAFLSKKAFFVSDGNTGLEEKILSEVNKLGIGPGGLGGDNTALAVSVLSEPTHIAGLPVAMTVNCWAERKCCLVFKEGEL